MGKKYDFCDKSVFTFRHNLIPYTAGRTACLLYCSGQLQHVTTAIYTRFGRSFLKALYSLYTALLQTNRLTDKNTLS